MKKIISSILIVLFITSSFAFFNTLGFKVKASYGTNIYNETNTYNVDTETFGKNVQKPGYEKGQYIIEYNMSNKKTECLVAENSTVTVFTHGYYSSSQDWLNNAEDADNEDQFVFQYNNKSMVDKVIQLYGVNNTVLLIANMTDYENVNLTRYVLSTNQNGSIIKESEEYNYSFDTEAYGKHVVAIFNRKPGSSNDSNNNIYFQFNYMLSKVLYDLKQLDPSHRIPKVNLIGHSRGGLTNLQYALDHPDIVENLISIGTPYAGSTSATIVKSQQGFKGDGLNDIINPTIYNGYKDRWNNNYNTLYKNINTVAIGAYSTLPFLGAVAHKDKSQTFNLRTALMVDAAVAAVSVYKYCTFFSNFFRRLAIGAVTKTVQYVYPGNEVVSVVDILTNEIKVVFPFVVWLSDTVVPLYSQLGIGYQGFKNSTKCFSLLDDTEFERIAQWAPPVVHNLEPWDNDIINMVVKELTPSVSDSTQNFKYNVKADGTASISGLKTLPESGILDIPGTIDGKVVTEIGVEAFADNSSIMSRIAGNENGVATYSTEASLLSGITTINIPSSVREIKNNAFSGLQNLTTVNFVGDSQLDSIGKNVFADCVNLKNITLPATINEIPAGTFENCVELESMVIPSSVTKIGAQAFSGAEKFAFSSIPSGVTEIGDFAFFGCKGYSSIYIPSGVTLIGDGAFAAINDVTAFAVSSINANYTVKDGVIYNKAKTELVQYPKGKTDDTFRANEQNATTHVRTIKPYAFYDCDNLAKVNINGVFYVEEGAFTDCSALAEIRAVDLINITVDALANTKWMETGISENNSQAVLDGLLIAYAPENKTVMELSDWGRSITAVAEQAFASTDLETIYIPFKVTRWNNGAFLNAKSLKDVYVEKMEQILLDSLPHRSVLFGNNDEDLTLHVTRADNVTLDSMGKTALSGIPREVISTTATCVKNGVTIVKTLYYGDNYTLDDSGDSVVWESSSGVRYANEGVWKNFETTISLNALGVTNDWLLHNGVNASPVSLTQGDEVTITYTETSLSVSVNGTLYSVNLDLPLNNIIKSVKTNSGSVIASGSTLYAGEFISIAVETAEREHNIRINYDHYDGVNQTPSIYAIQYNYVLSNLNGLTAILNQKNTIRVYNEEEYIVTGVYTDMTYLQEVTFVNSDTIVGVETWYIRCNKIAITVRYLNENGEEDDLYRIPYTELDSDGFYSCTLKSGKSRTCYTGMWKNENSKNTYDQGATVRINERQVYRLIWIANHSLTTTSYDDARHITSCSVCGYTNITEHKLLISKIIGNLYYHEKICRVCNYEVSEDHNWQKELDKFRCSTCNITAKVIPVIKDSVVVYLSIDESGRITEISEEEALLYFKKYELEYVQTTTE